MKERLAARGMDGARAGRDALNFLLPQLLEERQVREKRLDLDLGVGQYARQPLPATPRRKVVL